MDNNIANHLRILRNSSDHDFDTIKQSAEKVLEAMGYDDDVVSEITNKFLKTTKNCN